MTYSFIAPAHGVHPDVYLAGPFVAGGVRSHDAVGTIILVSRADGRLWAFDFAVGVDVQAGSLTMPAPAGHYSLMYDVYAGSAQVTLPEPFAGLTFAALAAVLARRRKQPATPARPKSRP